MIGIYRIYNNKNHQDYIGQSIHIEERWRQHLSSNEHARKNNKLYNDMEKYGIEIFDFSILELCTPEELNDKERYWIAKYDSYANGYNLTPGGQGQIFNNNEFFTLWDNGKTVGQIAEIMNCSPTTVQNYLKGYNDYNASNSHKRGGVQALQTAIGNNNLNCSTYYPNIYQYTWDGFFCKRMVFNQTN